MVDQFHYALCEGQVPNVRGVVFTCTWASALQPEKHAYRYLATYTRLGTQTSTHLHRDAPLRSRPTIFDLVATAGPKSR
jgi:hypothetical protein